MKLANNHRNKMGSCSANGVVLVVTVVLMILMVQSGICNATEYTVGDAKGWTYDVSNWPTGKHFKAGDVLVFKYDSDVHNVVEVDESGYNKCDAPDNAKTYVTGNDHITLKKGKHFFICGIHRHCGENMKIAVATE